MATAVVAALLMPAPASAEDAPTVSVRIIPDVSDVTVAPGQRAAVGLNVTVEYKDYSCQAGTRVGVDLVPAGDRSDWFGGNTHPAGTTYEYPKTTKPATLTIVVDADAPYGASGTYRLQPVIKFHSPAECGNVEPAADAPEFRFTVKTPQAPTSPPPSPGTETTSSIGFLIAGLCLLGAALYRGRRQ
jgi:hypothetical protein